MIAQTESLAGTTPLAQIENKCLAYDSACADLEDMIHNLEAELNEIRDRHLRSLKRQAARVAGLEADLQPMIADHPELFVRPRTLTLHGVKVGLTTSQGKVVFDDADTVIATIKKRMRDHADILIRTKEELNKDALRNLTAEELVKLGCRIEDAGDVVVLKRVAGDVEKLVNKLIEKMVAAMVAE